MSAISSIAPNSGMLPNVSTAGASSVSGLDFKSIFASLIQNRDAQGISPVTQTAVPPVTEKSSDLKTQTVNIVTQFNDNWQSKNSALEKAMSQIKGTEGEMLNLQLQMGRLQLTTELVTKTAETASNSLKKLQQVGQ